MFTSVIEYGHVTVIHQDGPLSNTWLALSVSDTGAAEISYQVRVNNYIISWNPASSVAMVYSRGDDMIWGRNTEYRSYLFPDAWPDIEDSLGVEKKLLVEFASQGRHALVFFSLRGILDTWIAGRD